MKIKPVITEKGLNCAKEGKYTFVVNPSLTKGQVKTKIEKLFGVHVVRIATANRKKEIKKTYRGQKKTIPATKKVVVTVKNGDSIDLFETKSK